MDFPVDVEEHALAVGAAPRGGAGDHSLSLVSVITTIGAIQVMTVACTLLQSKIAALCVGPAGIGVISFIDGIVAFVGQLSGLSLPFAALKGLAFVHDSGREEFARGYAVFLRAVVTGSLLGVLITIGVILLVPGIIVPAMTI